MLIITHKRGSLMNTRQRHILSNLDHPPVPQQEWPAVLLCPDEAIKDMKNTYSTDRLMTGGEIRGAFPLPYPSGSWREKSVCTGYTLEVPEAEMVVLMEGSRDLPRPSWIADGARWGRTVRFGDNIYTLTHRVKCLGFSMDWCIEGSGTEGTRRLEYPVFLDVRKTTESWARISPERFLDSFANYEEEMSK